MKSLTIKYFIALSFIIFFFGSLSITILPSLLKKGNLVSWQKQKSENNSPCNENGENDKVQEFVMSNACVRISPLYPDLVTSYHHSGDASVTRIFYLKVPTPPPDRL
ncbi:MAG: hypothetical protein JST47_11450 [Bacteroidetes bacterium]|nr:hypothetical protein [Bacteroidota bacterium]MBS1973080.1 hypothetical protein [Bacteroidota bacterium]